MQAIQRQLLLDLPRRLKGATVEPGQEAKVLTAPPLPDSNEHGTAKTMHIVLMPAPYPMRIEVEPARRLRNARVTLARGGSAVATVTS